MIDFHSHIIPEVDDGSDSIENSLRLIKEAKNAGFNAIILTPHYMEDYFEYQANEISDKIDELEERCREENIDIMLYQANEIYITNSMVELLDNNIATTINNSKYVLFELPMNSEPPNLLEVVYNLIREGKKPIIAHPERYSYIQKDPNKLLELLEIGVLFQSNYGSIVGQYGKDCQKTVKLLIKNNFIHFLGTDVHKNGQIYRQIDEIKKELEKIIPEEKIEDLMEYNAKMVLKDEKIDIDSPIPIKQGFFQKMFS